MIENTSRTRRIGWLLAAGTMLLLLLPAAMFPASADTRGAARHHTFCVPISATGTGQDVSDPTEMGVVRTEGTIAIRRHEIATTKAVFRITGGTPTVATFAGPLTIYPKLVSGRITADLVGTLNVSTATTPPTEATFTATATSVTGDGQLSGVTGSLEIKGVQNLVDGSFTETLTGQVCVPRGRQHTLKRALAGR